MSAKAQIIEANGKPEYAVIPYRDYLRLVEAEEDAEDLRAIEEFKRKLAAGQEELLPAEMVHRLVEGENAILVWGEYRGLTQAQLAKAAGVGQSYIAMIERGKRQGSVATLRAIGRALTVEVDDLLTAETAEGGGYRGHGITREEYASDAPSSATVAASGRARPRPAKRGSSQ